MADIIQLLPDHIANQIAAGEVIQRPASVVKELIENSIDAGSTEIKLIIKDAGKTLIQVIDNGKGMSETDARMSLERHATSKIRSANDLFSIKTMGFRGEAMASIAAISHLDIQTSQEGAEVGTHLQIKGSKIVKQEVCSAIKGTNTSVKNLFFNVPARRKFLKSDAVELKHIVEEFQRVALAHPEIFFHMFHGNNVVFHLPISNLRQRIVNVFGKGINDKLIPITSEMEELSIKGFIGKPENAKKSKGQQYIFVNDRFIKNHYLLHAIRTGYEAMITKEVHPLCVVFLEMDPAMIDINVHPTKTEIKFENERLIYNYLRVSVKHALGQYSLTPMLDFQTNPNLNLSADHHRRADAIPSSINNPSRKGGGGSDKSPSYDNPYVKKNTQNWDELYQNLTNENHQDAGQQQGMKFENEDSFSSPSVTDAKISNKLFQVHNAYIVSQIKSGLMIIDQQSAHERILYESNLEALKDSDACTQQLLFPITVELSTSQSLILKEILPNIQSIGFDIEDFGKNSFIVHGTPCQMKSNEVTQDLIEKLIVQYEENKEFQLGVDENIARSFAKSASLKRGKVLDEQEMEQLIQQLLSCNTPDMSPSENRCIIRITKEELEEKFKV